MIYLENSNQTTSTKEKSYILNSNFSYTAEKSYESSQLGKTMVSLF